jgi:hypothetical protein
MLVARKPLSVGPFVLREGDVLTAEMERHLPVGRTAQLVTGGFLDHKSDYAEATEVAALKAEVAELRAVIATLTERRGPGRPRKTEELQHGS